MSIAAPVIVDERSALTGLRGIAVAIVVLSHLGNAGMELVPGLKLNAIGKAGVWLFFVLSAFLLTTHMAALLSDPARSKGREIGRYAVNRFFRIFPLYLVVLLAHWGIGDLDAAGVVRHLLLVEGKDELWAIPVEFQYYVVIPVVALAFALAGRGVATLLLVIALAASVAFSVASPGKPFSNSLELLYRLPAFLAGSLAALWLPAIAPRLFRSAGFAVFAVAAALAATWLYRTVVLDPKLLPYWPPVAVLLSLTWTITLLGACRDDGALARLLSIRPLVLVGKASFGVYLWHMFAIRYFQFHVAWPTWVEAWIVVAATGTVAAVTWLAIERPGILAGRRLANALFIKDR